MLLREYQIYLSQRGTTMKVNELFASIRNTLQDNNKEYWDDSELLMYYNECVRHMTAERLEDRNTALMLLEADKYEYSTDGILRYIKCVDSNGKNRTLYQDDGSGEDDSLGIIIKNYNRVYVNTPEEGLELTFTIVTMPEDSNITSKVRIGDEQPIKYYMLSKAYEKDADMENFNKSGYFYSKFLDGFRQLKNSSSVNYTAYNSNTTKSYFY